MHNNNSVRHAHPTPNKRKQSNSFRNPEMEKEYRKRAGDQVRQTDRPVAGTCGVLNWGAGGVLSIHLLLGGMMKSSGDGGAARGHLKIYLAKSHRARPSPPSQASLGALHCQGTNQTHTKHTTGKHKGRGKGKAGLLHWTEFSHLSLLQPPALASSTGSKQEVCPGREGVGNSLVCDYEAPFRRYSQTPQQAQVRLEPQSCWKPV